MKKKTILLPLIASACLIACGGSKPSVIEYNVTCHTEGIVIENPKAVEKQKYSTIITIASSYQKDYILSENVNSVTVGKEIITNFVYTRNPNRQDASFEIEAEFVTSDIVITLGLEKKPDPTIEYEVTWDLDNGTEPIVETYNKGDTPVCKNPPAYRQKDEYEICYFIGWDKEIVPVTSNVTYKAQYEEESVRVGTVVTLVGLLPKNDTFTFAHEGDLVEVDWGDGTQDKTTSHKYTFPGGEPISVVITIYGKLTSFALSNENGILGPANKAVKNVVLAETITTVPDHAFRDLTYANCFMLDANLTYVGKDAMKKVERSGAIYLQNGFNKSALQDGWNPENCSVIENVTKLLLHYSEADNVFYGFVDMVIDGKRRFALADFYPYNGEQKTFEHLEIPSSVREHKVDAMIFSPFRNSKYNFNKITLPSTLTYVGKEGFRYSYVKELEIPASIETIKEDAFVNLAITTKISFIGTKTAKSTKIGKGGFSYLLSLEEINNFPSSVDSIDQDLFWNCPELKKVDGFGNCKITDIPYGTFGACRSLQEITLPATLKNISANAFYTPALATIDATRVTKTIPSCEENAFVAVASAATIKVDSTIFKTEAEAKAAFEAKGWPKDKFTYLPTSVI